MTQARHSRGARRVLFTVASFRIWRGSQVYVAQDPTLYIIARDMPSRGEGFNPAIADCGYRAPLAPRLVRPR